MHFYLAALVVLLVDQATKMVAYYRLQDVGSVEIIPGLFRLYYATNTGGAFSILSDRTGILIIFSVIAVVMIVIWQRTLPRRDWLMKVSLGLILGGAIGNLIDRFSRGYVVDFLDVHWRYRIHWPTFNLADSFICIGVGIVLLCTLLPHLHSRIIGSCLDREQELERQG